MPPLASQLHDLRIGRFEVLSAHLDQLLSRGCAILPEQLAPIDRWLLFRLGLLLGLLLLLLLGLWLRLRLKLRLWLKLWLGRWFWLRLWFRLGRIKNQSLGSRRELPETPPRSFWFPICLSAPPPLARAKFEHFYPESKGDRDTVFKRIPICVQPAQNRQIDCVSRVTDF